jgi:hypothetical protein
MPHFGKRRGTAGCSKITKPPETWRRTVDFRPGTLPDRYTLPVKGLSHFSFAAVLAIFIAVTHPLWISAADPAVTTPDGRPVVWAGWLEENGPVAVLLWASWVPDASVTLDNMETISAAARQQGLGLILVVVQEPLGEAKESLEGVEVRWFHDRYGHVLKANRVVSIPRILVISADGTVVEQLEAKPEAVRAWGGG